MNKFELQKLRRVQKNVAEDMTAILNNVASQTQKENVCDILSWALNHISETEDASIDYVLANYCGYTLDTEA